MLTRRYHHPSLFPTTTSPPLSSPHCPPLPSSRHPLTSPLPFQPAKTEAGAFTTQDADNAHTTSGTSAEDPNIPGSGKLGGVQGQVDNSTFPLVMRRDIQVGMKANHEEPTEVDQYASKEGVPKGADATINKEINREI